MKKSIIAILSLIMVFALLSACGKKDEAEMPQVTVEEAVTEKETEEMTKAEITTVAQTKEAETEAVTETESETEPETEKPTKEKATEPVEEIKMNKDAVIEETVLYDEEGLKIIAKEIAFSNSNLEIKLRLENSSDKPLSVTSNTLGYSCNAINGRMIEDGYIHAELAPGKNAIETAYIDLQELLLGGITEIAEIELGFTISDDDYNYIYTEPFKLTTSLYEDHDPSGDSYQKAINSDYLKSKYGYDVEFFTSEDLPKGDFISILSETGLKKKKGGSAVLIELLNTSDKAVNAAICDIALNGLRVTSGNWDSVTILGNHTATISVNLDSVLEQEFTEALGFSEYSLLNANMRVRETEDYTEDLEEFPIEIKLSDSEPSYDDTGDLVYDSNDIRIISKGFHEDPANYSDNIHLLFIVENTGSSPIYFTDKYDSFSINDLMTDAFLYSQTIEPKESVLMDLEVMEYNFDQADIKGIDDIETAQFTAEIRDGNFSVTESCELNFKNE